MIFQIIAAFVATICFAILFNVPKKELAFAGLCGILSQFIFGMATHYKISLILGTFLASAAVTVLSRFLAIKRQVPSTVFLTAGIIPLVPGAGVYDTVFSTINYDSFTAMSKGIQTFEMAGAIALGIVAVLALPERLFLGKKRLQ